jgi:hypothetical protein
VAKFIVLSGYPFSSHSITSKLGFIPDKRRQNQLLNSTTEEITKEIINRNESRKNTNNKIKVTKLSIDFN